MKTLFWIAAIYLGYEYLKNKGTLNQIISNIQQGANGNPNQSVTNTSPFFSSVPAETQPGGPGTPPGSLGLLVRFVRNNQSAGPFTGALIQF